MSSRQIGIKYKKQIARSRPDSMVGKHKRFCKIGQDPAWAKPPNPGTVTAIKEERHRKTVEDRINEVYERCRKLSKLAEGKAETARDFQAAANCLDPAIKALGLIKSDDPNKDDDAPGIDRAIAEMKVRNGKRVL